MIRISQGGYHSRHPRAVHISRPQGISEYLLLIVKTAAVYHLGEESFNVTPNSAVLISPHTPSLYGNPAGEYIDDWLQFSADAAFFADGQPLITDRFFPVIAPTHCGTLIQSILWENQYGIPAVKDENITLLTKALLNNLVTKQHHPAHEKWKNPYYAAFQELRLELLSSPEKERRPTELAQELTISLSHFQHLYRQFFGLPFQKEVISLRIEKAKNLLKTTDMTVEQIAELCGYHSEVHFYRQFQKITGVTPNSFRTQESAGASNSL